MKKSKDRHPTFSSDSFRLPDSSSDKENSHSRFAPHRPSARHAASDVRTDSANSAPYAHQTRRFDYVELSPVPASSIPRDSQSQEEKSTSSQWEALLSRKGSGGTGSGQRLHTEDEIEKKWAEFERLPLKEMSCRPTSGGQRASGPTANEALQREVVCGLGSFFP